MYLPEKKCEEILIVYSAIRKFNKKKWLDGVIRESSYDDDLSNFSVYSIIM